MIFGRRRSRNPLVLALARHALLVAILVVILYPLLWMVGASFRPSNEAFGTLSVLPGNLTTENYVEGWSFGNLNFSRFFLNSVVITLLAVVGNVVACSMAAYAFARLTFPFKKTMFALMLGTMLLPYHVTLVPQYVLFNELAWINTILPLVVPKFLATDAFFIFLMVQFIRTLPHELDDAARMDGCGHIGIFRRIVLPLSIPALGTTALFTFISTWNDFLGPLLYLVRPETWTVAQGLNGFLDATGESAYGPLFAMATLSLAPIVGFFLVAQRLLIEGIATSGLK
ncbi:carbohydrate ABC transporter permease [Pseudonocardia cypriaca]|uniref:Carbohydrate ABC transporter membrane protein 2 (CUT1 family) n=1 Tax=Pseudonocardia cypriaca TaxID=882449 RepID=A0A543FUC1_9PSEU|nr:carbohydrate ABC transporter permease [Pseudonocardia cypriaca]TQM37439.1 carbohydrate ABC transporter membrane protein 2 (CUT1 family) [Pseudonocardia cypriaca]